MANVGFIGLGRMGAPMALRLIQAGHTVRVSNRTPGKKADLINAGAIDCARPCDVAYFCDIIFVVVSDTSDVEAVLFGQNGIIEKARPGALVIDMSTISPIATRDFARRLVERGIRMLDAPVSGGVQGAADGTLSIMVGGDAAVLEEVRAILAVLGSRITHIGDHGAGQVAKMCNQLVVGLAIVAVAEALALAKAFGVDPAKVREALLGGFAGSRVLEVHGDRMLREDFTPGFAARLHLKDLGIVETAARAIGLILPGARLVSQLLVDLVGNGGRELDSSALLTRILPPLPPRD